MDAACRQAALIVARMKAGEEPVPEPLAVKEAKGPTAADLAAIYLKEVVDVRLKEASQASYRCTIKKHILPALGPRPALSVDHAAVEMLFCIYRAAEEREMIPEEGNPCRHIAKNRQRRQERFLTDEECNGSAVCWTKRNARAAA